MDFRQLESFISIAKNKSFSKAAKELYLTQPTISNHMQNLEKDLRTTLINRSNKQIELTKAGEIFYAYALDILSLKEKAHFSLGEYIGKIEGTIEIYASTIPEQYLLPGLLRDFSGEYPEVRYRINHLDSFGILSAIQENKIDYGFAGTYLRDSALEYIPLMKDELVLITPKNFPDREIRSQSLLHLPLILREEGSGTRNILAAELKKKKIDIKNLHISAYCENTSTTKNLVEEGFACAIVSKHSIKKELQMQSLKSFSITDLNLRRNFYLVYAKSRVLPPLEMSFIDFIRSKSDI